MPTSTAKYYCEYCNKLFNDTPDIRNKHLQSKGHKHNKQLYFDILENKVKGSISQFFPHLKESKKQNETQNQFYETGSGNKQRMTQYQPPDTNVINLPPSMLPPFSDGTYRSHSNSNNTPSNWG
eukprot:gb/GECH01003783.1/.p1 GENE.gb/GECH01003783.1/~~gb/GECH01003783.1/.p1  ORF type:complete len:124 (+),score=26.84 gb/GECH01003783.1/:1-372(+)